jgi:hypothetical protein
MLSKSAGSGWKQEEIRVAERLAEQDEMRIARGYSALVSSLPE